MTEVGNLLEKIITPMTIIIRVVRFVRISRIYLFFRESTYDLRWLHIET